jgi:hypothetical protein
MGWYKLPISLTNGDMCKIIHIANNLEYNIKIAHNLEDLKLSETHISVNNIQMNSVNIDKIQLSKGDVMIYIYHHAVRFESVELFTNEIIIHPNPFEIFEAIDMDISSWQYLNGETVLI